MPVATKLRVAAGVSVMQRGERHARPSDVRACDSVGGPTMLHNAAALDLLYVLRLELHCTDAVDLAIDVVVAID